MMLILRLGVIGAEAPLQNADLAIANLAPVFHLQRLPHQCE